MKITVRQASELSRKVHEALGAASVCCDPGPDELRVVERGLEIGANLMREIQEILGLEVEAMSAEPRKIKRLRFEYPIEYLDPEKIKANTKGNKLMDEEFFKRVEVDIEEFTRAAMELQVAVIDAEARLKDAQQRWDDVEKTAFPVKQRLSDAEKALEKKRDMLNKHLDSVRGLNVTVPAPPGWGKNLGERNA